MKYLILFLGLIMLFVSLSFMLIGGITQETKRVDSLCVDGEGDINLEGIMCKKEKHYVFGIDMDSDGGGLILFISLIILLFGGLMLFIVGLLELRLELRSYRDTHKATKEES
jgi:hypothetical protein